MSSLTNVTIPSSIHDAFKNATCEEIANAVRGVSFRSPRGRFGHPIAPRRIELQELVSRAKYRTLDDVTEQIFKGSGCHASVYCIQADVAERIANNLRGCAN